MAVMELTTNAKTTTTTTKPKLFNEIEENMADTIPYIHVTWFELVAQLSPPPHINGGRCGKVATETATRPIK